MKCLIGLAVLLAMSNDGFLSDAAESIPVQSALVRVLDEAEVPARDAGVLAELSVRAGDQVKLGQIIGHLDDDDAKVAVSRAELELAITERQVKNTLPVRTAEALLREAEQDRNQAELSLRIAVRKAGNDVAVRHATKSRDASKADFERAVQSRKTFAASVSQQELDRLRLIVERGDLEIEKAEFDRELSELQKKIEDATISEHDQAIDRLMIGVEQAKEQKEVDALTRDLKTRAVEQSQLQLRRRHIRSPLDGVVVEMFRQRGEWVEPGQRVLRIMRLDRLRVEGFVDSRRVRGDLRGATVKVRVSETDGETVDVVGKVTFVSPEVDPVNHQVRVWAEVDNPEFVLRPGLAAEMTIEVGKRAK